jgi:hypothetical protein
MEAPTTMSTATTRRSGSTESAKAGAQLMGVSS